MSVTARILVTLRTWVQSATILAQASQQATTPISTRFLLSSRKVCDFLQEGYLSPIVFARLESPTSKQFFLLFPLKVNHLTKSLTEGVMISIECRAYDQFILHNSQEAIGLVHFEVCRSNKFILLIDCLLMRGLIAILFAAYD